MLRKLSRTATFTICLTILLASLSTAYGQTYQIKPGDNLWRISNQFGVSVQNLKDANDLSSDLIYAGRELKIPQVHTVVRGNTLFMLARQYDTTVDAIKQANNLQSNLIVVGQRLTMPTRQQSNGNPNGQRMNVTSEEMDLLARAVYSEARGEPFNGQVAVAAVIFNRVEHDEFPNTISSVIFEPWAFTAVHDGQFWLTPNQTAYDAVEEALEGTDPSQGAIFYYNPVTATNQWIRIRPIITQIGRHVFAR
ncbi:MAG: LysM peptidoglycan-binding domain-containing protein [Firmicutes bacterium]|nr:LysM peptidoglycan-binding domain-containing protein [Bacillota bacterium]